MDSLQSDLYKVISGVRPAVFEAKSLENKVLEGFDGLC
jgi:hypothetical protein